MSVSRPDSASAVEPQPWILAHNPEVGAIFRCCECSNIHLALGPANLQVTPQTFLAVVEMFQRAASNFELMLETEGDTEPCE
ncbi:hypothetical protein F183_A13830 [Bryobacterales bacterium F-183]|nr:hypothetical protein F183_A13830 [Bryobacterales bacterium F-183]